MIRHRIQKHDFSDKISDILKRHFGNYSERVFESSPLLIYLNIKTKSANKGSKARGAFANHYAIYVLVKDYVEKGYLNGSGAKSYADYEGARFTDLMQAQRELPFGRKLQNHALNGRVNDEFHKYFHAIIGKDLIVRDPKTQRYWIQEDLIRVSLRDSEGRNTIFSIAQAVIDIIDVYVLTKKEAFESFIEACNNISEITSDDHDRVIEFISSQLNPSVDARIFEIVSFAILKSRYGMDTVWIGSTRERVFEESLVLYKTGRTNANDGGIDFVMRPLGRFFQVTETLDVNKYFLDIDKVQRFPITFVVKTNIPINEIEDEIRKQAIYRYKINSIVSSYMLAIEEIINIPRLHEELSSVVSNGGIGRIMEEIVSQSKLEFNYVDIEGADVDSIE